MKGSLDAALYLLHPRERGVGGAEDEQQQQVAEEQQQSRAVRGAGAGEPGHQTGQTAPEQRRQRYCGEVRSEVRSELRPVQ